MNAFLTVFFMLAAAVLFGNFIWLSVACIGGSFYFGMRSTRDDWETLETFLFLFGVIGVVATFIFR